MRYYSLVLTTIESLHNFTPSTRFTYFWNMREFIRNPDRTLFMSLQAPMIKNDSWYIFMTLLIDCSRLPINYSNHTDGKSAVIWFQYLSIFCLRNAIKTAVNSIVGVLRHLLTTQECLSGQKVDKPELRSAYLMTLK